MAYSFLKNFIVILHKLNNSAIIVKNVSQVGNILEYSNMPKTLLIDLDGVLNTYNGDYNENEIAPPRDGVKEFLEKVSKTYRIEIFTVRDKNLTKKWLDENNLNMFISSITNIKSPHASIIIDDRALRFNGDFTETFNDIENFKPFWQ